MLQASLFRPRVRWCSRAAISPAVIPNPCCTSTVGKRKRSLLAVRARVRCTVILLLFVLSAAASADDDLTIAVASNFIRTASELTGQFREETGISVGVSSASTGTLYAHILNGAPYDVFLAADGERPRLLEESGHAVRGSRFTYAYGALTFWSAEATDCLPLLLDTDAGFIALADPATAPYGAAAKEFLIDAGYWETVSGRVVYAKNTMQAMWYTATGNARGGVVARALLSIPNAPKPSCRLDVPPDMHAPIVQQAVLSANSGNADAARRFVEYLKSDAARKIIEAHGYGVEE